MTALENIHNWSLGQAHGTWDGLLPHDPRSRGKLRAPAGMTQLAKGTDSMRAEQPSHQILSQKSEITSPPALFDAAMNHVTSTSRKGRPARLAKNDCDTCVARRRKCDRSRPRCENCLSSGKICGGFAMQLSWQPGFSTHKRPVKRSITRRPRWHASEDSSGARQLEFITEYPGESTPENRSALTTKYLQSSTQAVHGAERNLPLQPGTVLLSPSPVEDAASEGQNDTGVPDLSNYDGSLFFNTDQIPVYLDCMDASAESQPNLNYVADKTMCASPPNEDWNYRPISNDILDDVEVSNKISSPSFLEQASTTHRELQTLSYHFRNTIPMTVRYNGHFERLESMFDRYNNEFCLIPLTLDLPLNPFRYRTEALKRSEYLLHAVLALSCHHTEDSSLNPKQDQLSETVLDHSRIALRSFRQALNSDSIARMASSLLDTIVILFSLDEAYSLLGNWMTHLTGAYNILELGGGINAWTTNPRTVVQVALLTWWDAVISLVNRSPCVFPYEYFESVLASCDSRFWTFFGLCGCPQSLVVPLVQLAHLAAEKQKSASMRFVVFDSGLISEIEQSLESWSHTPSDTASDDEESMHQDMDCMHCSEAWRHGLLLYIYRVFRWKSGDKAPARIVTRARIILDHACSCRDDQFVARQALLPLFFAGCEMADLSAHNRIRALCSSWNERTRYRMFGAMIPLLDEVWTAQMTDGPEYVWWGQIVDKKASAESRHMPQMRICFG